MPLSKPDPNRKEKLVAFDRLLTIMDELREHCPWDKKQTMESLRHLTIEETYELGEAILENDLEEVKKELGDLMLHLVFYSRIGSETNAFDVADVLNQVCDKLIRRHPHIYGDVDAKDEKAVKENWEKIKMKEKGNTSLYVMRINCISNQFKDTSINGIPNINAKWKTANNDELIDIVIKKSCSEASDF